MNFFDGNTGGKFYKKQLVTFCSCLLSVVIAMFLYRSVIFGLLLSSFNEKRFRIVSRFYAT